MQYVTINPLTGFPSDFTDVAVILQTSGTVSWSVPSSAVDPISATVTGGLNPFELSATEPPNAYPVYGDTAFNTTVQGLKGGGTVVTQSFTLVDTLYLADFYNDGYADNMFGYQLFASAIANSPNGDPDITASMNIFAPSISLVQYDDGNGTFSDPVDPNTYTLTYDNGPVTATPEPTSLALSATGLLGLAGVVRRKRRGILSR